MLAGGVLLCGLVIGCATAVPRPPASRPPASRPPASRPPAPGLAASRLSAPRPPVPGLEDKVLDQARVLRGTPYRYGGDTPRGFDCSGLVQYVFLQAANLKLPRTSKKQFTYSRSIRRGNEQPSDLLFFNINGRGPSHVGIYLGKGLFIHASRTGGNVKISDANSKYWKRRFIGVRRVL